jgi:isopentenyl diphosphate isomerase/L-lactate dehydrogenase-like FMN-dependent dehydrogenase
MKKISPVPQATDAIPNGVLNTDDYERIARDKLDPAVYAYIAGGCGSECTLRDNRAALESQQIYTRVLQDFSEASTSRTLLGKELTHPILLAPVAHQRLVHEQGELATAQACDISATPQIVSTLSSYSLEAIAAENAGEKWFQLYWQPQREITLDLVQRAERAGYSAIVVTVDTPVTALRYRAQRAGFVMPEWLQEVNLTAYSPAPRKLGPGDSVIFSGFMADSPCWQDIAWLRENTNVPIILKGITHPADAEKAKAMGLNGVVVSNHGGRSLDTVPATAKLLPQVRRTVGRDFVVLVDGGIGCGGDIFKSLALGADAVLIGRPQIYALAVAGALGVAHMLRLIKEELEVVMALAGCPTLDDINEHCLY